jgi:hypothetical protein
MEKGTKMTIKHLEFQDSGTIAYGSITNAYQTVLTLPQDADVVFFYNTTDAPMLFSVPGGSKVTNIVRLPAGTTMTIDCRTNSKRLAAGDIQVKYASAPTSGEVTVTVLR